MGDGQAISPTKFAGSLDRLGGMLRAMCNKPVDDANERRSRRERQDEVLRNLGFTVVTRRGTKIIPVSPDEARFLRSLKRQHGGADDGDELHGGPSGGASAAPPGNDS